MEVILVVGVFAVLAYWAFTANQKRKVDSLAAEVPSAPYKVPEPAATTPIPLVVTNSNPADNAPIVAATPAKKPKAAARTAKPKAPAKAPVKATAKAKTPAKPKATKAKPQA